MSIQVYLLIKYYKYLKVYNLMYRFKWYAYTHLYNYCAPQHYRLEFLRFHFTGWLN